MAFGQFVGLLGSSAPFGGVVDDVLADAGEVIFVTDDVFVVVALPNGYVGCAAKAVDALGGAGLEGANDYAEGAGL